MRLVADMIKGVEVNKALDMSEIQFQGCFPRLKNFLLSAIANWQAKNEGARIEESNLALHQRGVC
jgi:large subunit ribosomal protein L22